MKFRLRILGNILIASSIILLFVAYGPWIKLEVYFILTKAFKTSWQLKEVSDSEKPTALNHARELIRHEPLTIKPANTTSSIVIEKIGVSAPIVLNVPVQNREAYIKALHYGVAHAKGSALPGEVGNTYLFAHSSLNFWELGKYATVFNLLRKLEVGDRVVLFYKGKRFDYEVIGKNIVKGWNTLPLERKTTYPILTLQTCDPPGATINRLIITAKMVED